MPPTKKLALASSVGVNHATLYAPLAARCASAAGKDANKAIRATLHALLTARCAICLAPSSCAHTPAPTRAHLLRALATARSSLRG